MNKKHTEYSHNGIRSNINMRFNYQEKKQTKGRKPRGKQPDPEPVILTLSSDEEDSNSSTFASQVSVVIFIKKYVNNLVNNKNMRPMSFKIMVIYQYFKFLAGFFQILYILLLLYIHTQSVSYRSLMLAWKMLA